MIRSATHIFNIFFDLFISIILKKKFFLSSHNFISFPRFVQSPFKIHFDLFISIIYEKKKNSHHPSKIRERVCEREQGRKFVETFIIFILVNYEWQVRRTEVYPYRMSKFSDSFTLERVLCPE